MRKIVSTGVWPLFVLSLSSCGGAESEAIKFAEDCYTMETLLTRQTGEISIEEVDSLSAADEQNGISWRGSININYTIYNPRRDAWQDGKSVYNLVKKDGEFMVESGRPCSRTTPGMEIPAG